MDCVVASSWHCGSVLVGTIRLMMLSEVSVTWDWDIRRTMYLQVAVLLLLELDPPSKPCCMGESMAQGVNRASLIQLSSNVMSCKLSNDNSFSGSIRSSRAEGCASYIICVEMFASCGIAFLI